MQKIGYRGGLKVALLLGKMSFLRIFKKCWVFFADSAPRWGAPSKKGGECQIPQISLGGFGGFDIDLRGRCRNDYSVNNSSDG